MNVWIELRIIHVGVDREQGCLNWHSTQASRHVDIVGTCELLVLDRTWNVREARVRAEIRIRLERVQEHTRVRPCHTAMLEHFCMFVSLQETKNKSGSTYPWELVGMRR